MQAATWIHRFHTWRHSVFCFVEFPAVSCCGFVFSKVLLDQPRLFPHGDAGDLGDMPCGIRCSDERRIQDLICLYPFRLDFFPSHDCLLVSQLCQFDIRGAADFVFHVPDGLSVPHILTGSDPSASDVSKNDTLLLPSW